MFVGAQRPLGVLLWESVGATSPLTLHRQNVWALYHPHKTRSGCTVGAQSPKRQTISVQITLSLWALYMPLRAEEEYTVGVTRPIQLDCLLWQ